MRKSDVMLEAAILGCKSYTPDGIFIEPAKIPKEKCHSKRSKKEMDLWWGRVFITKNGDFGFNAYCFDGGAWDRATWIAHGKTVEDCADAARARVLGDRR